MPWDLIFVDLETAGAPEHRIIEIGAVRLGPDLSVIDRWESLVDGRPVSPEVVEIHGIRDEDLEGKPKFGDVHAEFDEWCAKSEFYLLAAFGAYFDVPVLRAEYDRIGKKFPHRGEVFDVKPLVWWFIFKKGLPARSLKLDKALELLGLKQEGRRHRGLDDAWNEARLLLRLAGKI